MRVVAGEAKGRKLKSPKTPDTRPIIDRVKTALFDILSPRIRDTRFLDLFAGTGGVGIEALSRGAAFATFIELNGSMLQLVRENLRITGLLPRAETIRADAFKFLQAHATPHQGALSSVRTVRSNAPYDIIYVAPPQYQKLATRALVMLDSSPLVDTTGLVIVQVHPKEREDVLAVPLARLLLRDERRYGSTLLLFYEVRTEKSIDVDTTTTS